VPGDPVNGNASGTMTADLTRHALSN